MKRAGYVWFLLLLSLTVRAQQTRQHTEPTIVRPDATGEVPLRGHLYHFVDSSGQLSLKQVFDRQRVGQFQPSASLTNRQDFGYNTTAVHWLYFELETPTNGPQQSRLMLEVEYANLDELQLTEVGNGRILSAGPTGDRFQYSQRPYQNNNYVFPIRLRAGSKIGYFLRVKQPHAILSFFVRLWNRPTFVASDRTEYFLWGIYVGIICIVLVLNMVMLLALRDWIYLWYSLYLHFMTMHLFSDAGLGFQYLWPTFPRLNEFLPVYLYVWAGMVAQTTFMQYFIHQNRHTSQVYRWVNAFKTFVTVALITAIGVQWLNVPGREEYMYQLVSMATSLFVPVIAVLTVMSLVEASRRERVNGQGKRNGETMVRFYSYALAVQFTGYMVVAIMNFCQAQGWPLPFDVETYVVLGLTVLADLVFFTYGLTYRYSRAKQHNQQLELDLLNSRQVAQQQVIESLQDERQRLAQDLHDDVGPLLATAKGYLSRLARTDLTTPVQQAQTLIDEAADELRTLSHQLLPKQLEQTSLVNGIAEAARKSGSRGVPVQFVSLGAVRPLGSQREQLLFSLAIQLMRHAQKHPDATEVVVQLLYHEAQLNLSVEDDGRPVNWLETDGANLRAKADLLKAELLIDATESGNSVMVSLLIDNVIPA